MKITKEEMEELAENVRRRIQVVKEDGTGMVLTDWIAEQEREKESEGENNHAI